MRFLLTFHCEATGQWRCLDTALLPAFSGRAEDLPAALRASPDLVMRWMLGRHEFADALIPAAPDPKAPGQGGLIAVYALGPGRSVIGFENEYNGPWLEMFRLENRPLGHLVAHKVSAEAAAMAALADRAAHPLHATDEACRRTVGRIAEHQQQRGRRCATEAGREGVLAEKT